MHDTWKVAEAVIGVSQRVLLRGKPGTGKTYAATHLALREDQQVFSVTMTEETPMAEFRGHFIQQGGDFIWHDGPGVEAWLGGHRLVINEIDRASDDILSFMYAIMDDPDFAQLTLPDGRTIRPAEGFQLVATMNGVPEDLPEALQDRLPVSIEITDVNPAALERLPEDLRGPAENTSLVDNGARGISIRAWLEFAHLRTKLGDDIAAQAVFADKAKDALLAINVSNIAEPAHDMEGAEISLEETEMRESVNGWLSWWQDNRDSATVITSGDIEANIRRVIDDADGFTFVDVEYNAATKDIAVTYAIFGSDGHGELLRHMSTKGL